MEPLTPEEYITYTRIIKSGKMDDMFDFGYAMGRVAQAKEALDIFQEVTQPKK